MFGFRPDPFGHAYSRFVSRFRATSTAPRDLRPFAPRVLNQGSTSSCTGHGTSTGLVVSCAVAGEPLGFIPSPRAIYTNAIALDRAGARGSLRDEGAMPNQVVRGLSEFGVRPMTTGADTDCDFPGGVVPEPTLEELEAEAQHVYVGWYSIGGADEARAAIAAGAPVGIGTYVDSAFMAWTPSKGPIGRMNQSDPRGGGHWTVLLGSEVGGIFHLRNSWGTSWGDHGDAVVTDAFVSQADQLIAFGYRRIGS